MTTLIASDRPRPPWQQWLQSFGDGMARHRRLIIGTQWAVVLFYFTLVAVPAFLTLPDEDAHIFSNLTLFAQFLFWGIWWPFVMVSMMAMGRVWCGVFCPEGALSEWASSRGFGLAIPRWMRWGGWPFVSFASTTLVGQLTSIYQYPKPVLLILGGSTAAAIVVGLLYGRHVRVWCRYLCPANGVFALLSRLAPVHFSANRQGWNAAPRESAVNCPPLLDVKRQAGTGACHACGRCSGHREAVALLPRSPSQEILGLKSDAHTPWEVVTLAFGVLGIAMGAFQWSASPWFVQLKQQFAELAVNHEWWWLLADNAPWWLLTHYPEANDVFTWLDGASILLYILAEAALLGSALLAGAWMAARCVQRGRTWLHLAYAYTPLAGIAVFLGLSMTTLSLLKPEGINLAWVPVARVLLLGIAVVWTLVLGWQLLGQHRSAAWQRGSALLALLAGMTPVLASWILQFYVW